MHLGIDDPRFSVQHECWKNTNCRVLVTQQLLIVQLLSAFLGVLRSLCCWRRYLGSHRAYRVFIFLENTTVLFIVLYS